MTEYENPRQSAAYLRPPLAVQSPPPGPPSYDQPYAPAPSAPGTVIAAAVLGFLVGAFGVLGTLLVVLFGPVLFELAANGDDTDDQTAARIGAGLTLLFGVLMLAWTVSLLWGAMRALRGSGRVPLLVAGSIGLAGTLLGALDVVTSRYVDPVALVFMLVFLLASLAIVVLLCLPASTQFFTTHRARRAR
jgi:hypothetical protein